MKSVLRIVSLLLVLLAAPTLFASTWYVRPDGGTRYSANVSSGQCDGTADTPYPGHGRDQHCAFKDFRYLWDDDSGRVGAGEWVIKGGDTVILRGCSAESSQANPSNPNCRVGWDAPTGTGANRWCYGVGSYTCYNPPIPAGTASRHTRILGQNHAACNAAGATNPRQYASNLTQIFGGFSLSSTLNLQNTQYVDVQCIELTTHNGMCTRGGSPAYPRACKSEQPLDDYAQNGFLLNEKSANITLQDVYIHGFNGSAFDGPIGGPIALNRVFAGFNGFSGWNFDDGHNTANAPGSSIEAHYVTMIGNGCYEEYPVKHEFSARACYDDESGGFGDAWSGQDSDMDSFVCDHCVMAYNTKDAFMGPHTNIHTLTITNSMSYGNMGAQWKWNSAPGATVRFINNLTIGNCARMSQALPGAAHSFDRGSGLPGAYLSDYCRAGANTLAFNSQQRGNILFTNNSFVDDRETVFLLGCGPSNANRNGSCGQTSFVFANNIFLGYSLKGGEPPALFFIDDPSIKISVDHNIFYGNRSGYGANCRDGNICSDPRFINEPPQKTWSDQSFLDNFNFHLASGSPAAGHGKPMSGVTSDFFGTPRPNSPTVGAVESHP